MNKTAGIDPAAHAALCAAPPKRELVGAQGKGPWVVVLTGHTPYSAVAAWGPFYDWKEVAQFFQYVCREIDPAVILGLQSPVGELLAWREAVGLPAVQAQLFSGEEASDATTPE